MAGKSLLRQGAVAAASKLVAEGTKASIEWRTSNRISSLYKRLSALGAVGGSLLERINGFIAERRSLSKVQLMGCVKELHSQLRHEHALEILDWMDKQNASLNHKDHALRLDLISKVRGVAAAEDYFNSFPLSAKPKHMYVSLLNCYCKEMMDDKVLSIFKEMELLNYAPNTLVFNDLLFLYLKLGKPEKVSFLIEEMKLRKIPLHVFSYNVWMQSYALRNSIDGVEAVFQDLLDNNPDLCDWTAYRTLSEFYIKAGLYEKAESALKKLESVKPSRQVRSFYHLLISMYAGLSNLKEVHRIWETLRLALPTNNWSYFKMLVSLERLGDFDGLQRCFQDWQTNYTCYDIRITKPVIRAYLKQDMVEEATLLYKEATSKATTHYYRFTELFVVYFLDKGRADLALDYVDDAVSGFRDTDWRPHGRTVDALFRHFEESKDVESAEKMFIILKKVRRLKKIGYALLLSTHSAAGKTKPGIRQMLQKDKIDIDYELEKLLDTVCPL